MDDSLIAAHRDLPALMPYVHLPVQSGSDRILAAMNRKHTRAEYLAAIERLRARAADLAFTSDFIVGFPGETEQDFRDTLALVEEVGFRGAYTFMYSPRPGTPAAEMGGQVPEAVKSERLQRLQALHHPAVARLITRSSSADTVEILLEKPGRCRANWSARTPYLQTVQVMAPPRNDRRGRAGRHHRHRHQHVVRRDCDAARPRRSSQKLEPEPLAQRTARDSRRPPPPRTPRQTQIVLDFDDNRLASVLFGQYGQNLALIERRLGVVADQRGNHVTIDGSRGACEQARRVLEGLYEQVKRDHELAHRRRRRRDPPARIAQGSLFDYDPSSARSDFEEINLRKRPVRARTAAQDAYMRAFKNHSLVFGTGPAGTGKTWLAVAYRGAEVRAQGSRPHHPVAARGRSRRTARLPARRHAREGRSLSAADLRRAVRHDGCAHRRARACKAGEIEIAPLAFMRGRTLSNAAIILDEAQNTTSMQMKMFLTRLGENSHMIVTGDPSQVDLPTGQKSGLAEAVRLLEGVEGIGHVAFTASDVIRHELVSRIVAAYDRAGSREAEMSALFRTSSMPIVDMLVQSPLWEKEPRATEAVVRAIARRCANDRRSARRSCRHAR